MVAPVLPELQHALHTSASSSSWIFTSFLLGASTTPPIVGRLGDIYGKKRLIVLVLALLLLGTLISALSTSLAPMLVGRVLQGASGSFYPLAFGIIRDEFPRGKVAGSVGMMTALTAVGGTGGVVLGGPIAHQFSIHYIFWLSLIPIAASMVLTILVVPESPVRAPSRIDWLAAALLGSGLAITLFGVTDASHWHWLSAKTIGCLAIGIATLALWVRREIRSDDPLVDMRMMRIRGIWTTNLVGICLGFGMYAYMFLISLFLETPRGRGFAFGASASAVGVFLIPSTVASLIASSQLGRIEKRVGSKPPLIVGAALCAGSYLALAFAHTVAWEIYAAAIFTGAGVGLSYPAMTGLIIENVEATATGVATGVNSIMRNIGGAAGSAVSASVLAASAGFGGLPTVQGYTIGFGLIGVVAVFGTLIAFAVPQRRPEHTFAAHPVGDLAATARNLA